MATKLTTLAITYIITYCILKQKQLMKYCENEKACKLQSPINAIQNHVHRNIAMKVLDSCMYSHKATRGSEMIDQ